MTLFDSKPHRYPATFWCFTFGFLLNNCAFSVLMQLQSSINPYLGTISISFSHVSSMLVCLFVQPILFKMTSKCLLYKSSYVTCLKINDKLSFAPLKTCHEKAIKIFIKKKIWKMIRIRNLFSSDLKKCGADQKSITVF